MTINDFHKSIEAVFGPCAIYAKSGDREIIRGWEGTHTMNLTEGFIDWERIKYDAARK